MPTPSYENSAQSRGGGPMRHQSKKDSTLAVAIMIPLTYVAAYIVSGNSGIAFLLSITLAAAGLFTVMFLKR
jgi:hypothetical protein